MTTSGRESQLVVRGSREPAAPARLLRAGPLEAVVEGADLRHLEFGGVEILRRLYTAVRDSNWGTLTPVEFEVATEAEGGTVRSSWQARYEEGELALSVEGAYVLQPNGVLTASFRALALSAFRYNRIGLCILHPAAEFAGQPYAGNGPAGTTRGTLPARIGPQWIVDGLPAPLFPAVSELELVARGGARVRLAFEGDLFEVEDQRNWTDDSFKTYSTPLALGFPHDAVAGQRFDQFVTLTIDAPTRRPRVRRDVVSLRLGEPLGIGLPRLGLGEPSHDKPVSEAAAGLLRAIHPFHLRVAVPTDDDGSERAVAKAQGLATLLGTRIQLVLALGSDCASQLERLCKPLAPLCPFVSEVVVLASDAEAAGGERVRLARQGLADILPTVRFLGGTDASFCQLNRASLDAGGLDGVAYAIHPQEHAFDDASLFETLAVQAETVRSAQALFPGLPVAVGPVTLRPRFNASATEPESERPGTLPTQVDPRQLSLLAAAWTVGSIKYLAEAGADSVTYYEATGWRGLVENEGGSLLPDLFPSRPLEVFPSYHVLADAADLSGMLRPVASDEPLAAVALAVADGAVHRVLLANLRAEATAVEVLSLPGGTRRVRRLNEESAVLAADQPNLFRGQWSELAGGDEPLRLVLEPYEVARVDTA